MIDYQCKFPYDWFYSTHDQWIVTGGNDFNSNVKFYAIEVKLLLEI